MTTEPGVPAANIFFKINSEFIYMDFFFYKEVFVLFVNPFLNHHSELYNAFWQYWTLDPMCRQEKKLSMLFFCKPSL